MCPRLYQMRHTLTMFWRVRNACSSMQSPSSFGRVPDFYVVLACERGRRAYQEKQPASNKFHCRFSLVTRFNLKLQDTSP
jgi:hypothetical protein